MSFDADKLYAKYAGQSLDYDGVEADRGQCVQWVEYVLTDSQYGYGLQPFWGNAIDWWNNYGGSLTAFNKVTDGSVKKGDIVIFNSQVGSVYGHIDLAMADGNTNSFQGADSNWGGNKTVHLVQHNGSQYVLGSLRLKGGNMSDVPADLDTTKRLVNNFFGSTGTVIDSMGGFDKVVNDNVNTGVISLITAFANSPQNQLYRTEIANAFASSGVSATQLKPGLYKV